MLPMGHLFECYGYSNQGFHIYLAQGLRQGEAHREHTEQDMISRAFPVDEVLAMISRRSDQGRGDGGDAGVVAPQRISLSVQS